MQGRYETWERSVISEFWDKRRSDPALRDALYESDKVVLAIFRPADLNAATRPPDAFQLTMYHMGSERPEAVDHGTVGSEFWFAATDTGGLTNARVRATRGGIPALLEIYDPQCVSAERLYAAWRRHSGRRAFYGDVLRKLRLWMKDVPAGYLVAAVRQREGRRLIVPASLVRERTGEYLLRDYRAAGPYAKAATTRDVDELYCSVQPREIIPNFNRNNIRNEHVPVRAHLV